MQSATITPRYTISSVIGATTYALRVKMRLSWSPHQLLFKHVEMNFPESSPWRCFRYKEPENKVAVCNRGSKTALRSPSRRSPRQARTMDKSVSPDGAKNHKTRGLNAVTTETLIILCLITDGAILWENITNGGIYLCGSFSMESVASVCWATSLETSLLKS